MNGYLYTAYREQLEMYPPLTQEEVEEIYAREGIQDKPISEMIEDLEEEIRTLKSERDTSIREIQEKTCETHKKRYREICSNITALEEKKHKLREIQNELEELIIGIDSSAGVLSSIAVIDKEIKRLKDEWHKLNRESQELNDQKDAIDREATNKIKTIEDKLSKIKVDYATVFKQLYSASRGIMRRTRKFPSSELRNEIVLGHLGLARSLAAKYFKMCDGKIEFDDLHQIAYEALMSAAHYYIPSPRAKFKTYATKCIENKLKRSIGEIKKKKRNAPTKPLEFIDAELRRIDYVIMLIDACRNVRGKDGNKYFTNHFDLKPMAVQYNFKQSIRAYNSELRKLGLTKEQLPTFKVKNSEASFQEILKIALSFMKDSKMKVLISSEDMEMANLVVSSESHANDVRRIYELLYTIELYQKRLKDVRMLLEVELDLAKSSGGIVPSKEELLDEINRRISIENKGIYKAKHSSTHVSYENLASYRNIYYELWRIDFLAEKEDKNSRAKEISGLKYSFESKCNEAILYYRWLIDAISSSTRDKVCLYKNFNDDEEDFSFLVTWEDEPLESLEERIFTKEAAIDFLKELIKELESLTEEDFVNRVLNKRKRATLDTMNEANTEIIKRNRALESTVRQQRTTSYVRYWTIENVQAASEWMNALYESGLAISNSDPSKNQKTNLSVEDEAIDHIFMMDYNNALESLPPLSRDVMRLYYDENGTRSSSAREIAQKLSITEKAVYREKDKALKLLRKNDVLKAYLE